MFVNGGFWSLWEPDFQTLQRRLWSSRAIRNLLFAATPPPLGNDADL